MKAMRNYIKKAGVLCATASVVVALLTVTGVQPASAASCGKLASYYNHQEGQVHNCPANGPVSWI